VIKAMRIQKLASSVIEWPTITKTPAATITQNSGFRTIFIIV
jgi:hypothetical protein